MELTEQGRARQSLTTHSGAKKKGGSLGPWGQSGPLPVHTPEGKIFIFFPPLLLSLLPLLLLLRPFYSSSERSVLLTVFSFFFLSLPSEFLSPVPSVTFLDADVVVIVMYARYFVDTVPIVFFAFVL